MDFARFCDTVMDSIALYLPESMMVNKPRLVTNTKTNLGERTGIAFAGEAEGSLAVSPVIYLNDLYTALQEGEMSMTQVMESVAKGAMDGMAGMRMDGLEDTAKNLAAGDWNTVKGDVVVRAIGYSMNKELLEKVPHRVQGDIAMVARIMLPDPDAYSRASVLVTTSLMDHYGITREELFAVALENTAMKEPPVCISLNSMLENLMGMPFPEEPGNDLGLYVLTNADKCSGAASVFLTDAMDSIAKEFPEGFYILPSSIHEVLILPKSHEMGRDSLESMVREINANEVAPEDRLSDLVHEYDPKTRHLTCEMTPELEKVQDKPVEKNVPGPVR